jgi:hypothetical protein
MGPLAAILNEPANEGWPSQGVDRTYAGSAYSTPYTRKRWAPGYGLSLQEAVKVLVTEMRAHHSSEPHQRLPRELEHAIWRVSSYGRLDRLTPAKVKHMIAVVELAKDSTEDLKVSMSMAIRGLELILQGTGLKPVRYRYTRKSRPRKEVLLEKRLSALKRKAYML